MLERLVNSFWHICPFSYCRELLNAHRDNLGTMVKFVIFNELSNARNPNNMQILYTVLQHSSELAPKVTSSLVKWVWLWREQLMVWNVSRFLQFLAMVFQDLLTNKEDYLRASRALLREIIKQTKHEINFQAFCLGLMQERKEPQYTDMEFKVACLPYIFFYLLAFRSFYKIEFHEVLKQFYSCKETPCSEDKRSVMSDPQMWHCPRT